MQLYGNLISVCILFKSGDEIWLNPVLYGSNIAAMLLACCTLDKWQVEKLNESPVGFQVLELTPTNSKETKT